MINTADMKDAAAFPNVTELLLQRLLTNGYGPPVLYSFYIGPGTASLAGRTLSGILSERPVRLRRRTAHLAALCPPSSWRPAAAWR